MPETETLQSLSRIRTAATWLRKTGKPLDEYPKLNALSAQERLEAKQFAVGAYPWPARWTIRLYKAAKAD